MLSGRVGGGVGAAGSARKLLPGAGGRRGGGCPVPAPPHPREGDPHRCAPQPGFRDQVPQPVWPWTPPLRTPGQGRGGEGPACGGEWRECLGGGGGGRSRSRKLSGRSAGDARGGGEGSPRAGAVLGALPPSSLCSQPSVLLPMPDPKPPSSTSPPTHSSLPCTSRTPFPPASPPYEETLSSLYPQLVPSTCLSTLPPPPTRL